MSSTEGIDEGLYSRQIYALGLEAMKRMATASVLISGLGGLGVEIAKNIVLMGVNKVTLHDKENAKLDDLASQFFLTEEDIGKNRAKASLNKVAELNHHVKVSASDEDLTEDYIKQFNSVVVTSFLPFSELKRISEICHQNKIKFIATQVSGLFGYVFDDFGEKFDVFDPRGEIPSRFLIEHITHDKDGVVTVADGGFHNLNDEDLVRFEEVEGMTELNNKEFPIKFINARKFSIGDTSKFGEYELKGSGGYGNQIIPPKTLNFKSFMENLTNGAAVLDSDFTHWGRDRHNLVAFITAARYADEYKGEEINEEKFVALSEKVNEEYKICDDLDKVLMKRFAQQNCVVISPMAAVFGGIVGQEVLKSISGKYLPVNQFYTLCYIESTTEDIKYEPKGDRYDPYRKVFGNELQEKMMNLKYFMIGAGAIGCEILKNWAMMGLFTGKDGKLTLTDMDTIELSNLSRQFLFRDKDIGQYKSETAMKAVQKMNKDIKIEAQEYKLAEETRNIYSDKFYQSIDGVCNALDNIAARLFSDKLCVYYGKPLLESGTLGPKANYQVIVPGLTESYGDSKDPAETSIPQCTIHNFPSLIDHCCEWARDIFGGIFEQPPVAVNKFAENPQGFIDEMKIQGQSPLFKALTQVIDAIENQPKNYQDCVNYARRLFDINFTWRIEDLLKMYPPDKITEEGVPFWSGTKREPVVIKFDPTNELHLSFIDAAAKIHARIYGIKPEGDLKELAAASNPGERVKMEDSCECELTDNKLEALEKKALSLTGLRKLGTESFEKDDDSNSHIDFIAAASNLRASNYRIKNESRLEIKRIAGKIIPAIATTTAMICGFVMLEMYKIHSIVPRKISEFCNGFVNLAIAMFSFTEPIAAATVEKLPNGKEYTIWDKIEIKGDITIKEFIDKAKELTGYTVKGITYGSKQIYSVIYGMLKKKKRLATKVSDAIKEVTGADIDPSTIWLHLECTCYIDDELIKNTPPFILSYKE